MTDKLRKKLLQQVDRWRKRANIFVKKSSSVEGPMDDILKAESAVYNICALAVEEIAEQEISSEPETDQTA